MSKIDMVLVIYNPNSELLLNCISSIENDIRNIYIIDNGSKDFEINRNSEKIKLIRLKENMGIAYAQNIGLKEAIQNNADYILLSDQDTSYPKDYIEKMIKNFSINERVCAIAPLFKDINSKKINDGFYIKSFLYTKRIFPNYGFYELFHTIASGKIINAKYLYDIGFMNEKLFIDWVDYEWCWRARNKGYKIIGNAYVTIHHQLGNESKDIGFREINLRSYIRHYYITRNAFYLALYSKNLNISNKIVLFFKSFRYIVAYPVLTKPHLKNLKYVLLGFWHGINKKLGKLKVY